MSKSISKQCPVSLGCYSVNLKQIKTDSYKLTYDTLILLLTDVKLIAEMFFSPPFWVLCGKN